MSLDLQSLRTAKAALDEGLLDANDYATVKNSFINAQSIKAGAEAGFISETDYAEARKAFFGGLGMIHGNAAPTGVQAVPASPAGVGAAGVGAAPAHAAAQPTPGATVQQPSSSPDFSKEATTPPPVSQAPPAVTVPNSAPTPEVDAPESTSGGSIAPTPTGLTDRGGIQAVTDKRSMAGIQVDADAVNILWEVNIKKRYRWVSYHIGQGGKQVEIEKCGQPESTWTEFIDTFPDDQCRYGVFDYEYTNSEGTKFGKLCFVSWAPDEAAVKKKMQHSSTKDFFRSMLEGIAVEVHATDKGDLGETNLRDRVAQTVAKK